MDQNPICSYEGGTNLLVSSVLSPDNPRVVSRLVNTTARVWNIDIGQVIAIPVAGQADAVITYSLDGTLRILNSNTSPFKSKSGFLRRDSIRDGWVCCSDLMDGDIGDLGLLFGFWKHVEKLCVVTRHSYFANTKLIEASTDLHTAHHGHNAT